MQGQRPEQDVPFQPQTIDTATLSVSGTGAGRSAGGAVPPETENGVAFEALTATAVGGLTMTGRRDTDELVAFEALTVTASGGLTMTGRRDTDEPVAFEALTVTAPGGLTMTGRRQTY